MKPHEANLDVVPYDSERRCIIEDGGRMVAIMRTVDAEEWERFILGGPRMARAVLEALERIEYIPRAYTMAGAPVDQIRTASKILREALTLAGVPCP